MPQYAALIYGEDADWSALALGPSEPERRHLARRRAELG
jgi:hypothetical protein